MSDRDGGYTLVETVVALAILTGFLVLFSSGIAGGWRGIDDAQKDKRALATARKLIETAGISWPLSAGVRSGRDAEGFAYEISVEPYRAGASDADLVPLAHWVTVSVQPPTHRGLPRRSITLRALKRASAS